MTRRDPPRRAARALARFRGELQLLLVKSSDAKYKMRKIPRPVYPLETFSSDGDNNIDSDSPISDGDATLTDPDIDLNMAEGESTNQVSKREQNHIEHLSFIGTAKRVDLPEDVQEEEEDAEVTFSYPDPITSEMVVPPPTPRLSHVELPIVSVEIDIPNNKINETPEAVMEDLDGGLSTITNLMRDSHKTSLPLKELNGLTNSRKTNVLMQSYEDANLVDIAPHTTVAAASLPFMDTNTSETGTRQQELEVMDLSDARHRPRDNEQRGWSMAQIAMQAESSMGHHTHSSGAGQTPGSAYVDTSDIDVLQEGSEEKMDLPDIPHGTCGQSGAEDSMQGESLLKTYAPPTALNHIPGLGWIAIHTDNFVRSAMADPRGGSLPEIPEQPPAAEPASDAKPTITAEQEGVLDCAFRTFVEDVEKLEVNILASVEAERSLLCWKHNAADSEHNHAYPPYLPAKRQLEMRGVLPWHREESRSEEEKEWIRGIKTYRCSLSLGKKHAVWERSLLCAELKAEPLRDREGHFRRGGFREWYLFHTGRGPTGGDPFVHFWRPCVVHFSKK